MNDARGHPAGELAGYLSALSFDDLPAAVVERAQELFLDWVASALAGRNAKPVQVMQAFARAMGPADGPSEILVSRRRSSPLFAALINAASCHVVEQDDVHNGSVLHPGAVVFPAVLAAAQSVGASGRELITAATVGYESGIRIGEFLGRSHYRLFHTTGTAGTLAAAAAVASVLGLNTTSTLHALGNAGTQAAGLWEFLREGADSKQLHTAKAAADGLTAAYLARDGLTGAHRILTGEQGLGAALSSDADPGRLTDRLGRRWALRETSFKHHASCRHTHPAADALLSLMRTHQLGAEDIARVRARVHQGAIDVLGSVTDPLSVHQAKFSMGFVLALIARYGRAGVDEFNDQTLGDAGLREWGARVEMILDPEIDAAYPDRWLGRVEVETRDGRRLHGEVAAPKGDPDNTLSRDEIEVKALRLAAYRDAASESEMRTLIGLAWRLPEIAKLEALLPRRRS